MNIRAYIYILCSMWLTAACTTDADPDSTRAESGKVRVGLRINTFDGTTVTRADANATTDEMMNIWTVVVVNDDNTSADYNKVVAIHACKPTATARDEDDYVDLTPGTYRFYSFANMAPSVVMSLLGIGGTGATGDAVTRADGDPGNNATTNDTIPRYNGNQEDTFYYNSTIASDEVHNIAFDATATVTAATANAAVATVGGNGFNPTAANNFGAQGIPMSNVQTKEITSTTTFDLILVRMMAKMELQIRNQTGGDITISRITLSNVTQNTAGNLKLLPTLSNPDSKSATPRDIRPNLGTALQDNYTWTDGVSITAGGTEDVRFYVNESATPTNADGLFYLTLEMNDGSYRYALISDDASNNWNYIARNDYRIIPVTLDDVKFELIPYDFPPIGVYPVSVKQLADHLYDFEFHDYGHFHLVPQVTHGATAIAYAATPAATGYSWSLMGNDWASSFFTFASRGDATAQTTNNVLLSGTDDYFYSNTTRATDADDAESMPVFDTATGWDGFSPFIFGYIADPPAAWWGSPTDRRVYHEMKIQIYKDGAAYRQAVYRFYMTLSAQQMLGATARSTAHRRPHGH